MLQQGELHEAFATLSRFRGDFYDCLNGRGDALFELADALLRTDGRVRRLVDLALAPEHRRGHGALYGALNKGAWTWTGCGGRSPGFRCGRPRTAAWPLRSTSRRGCGRTPPPARTAPSATPTAGVTPSAG
ncbi:hypothetical protein GCM10009579_04940 [Streptomyces javensis]|uniref:Transposase IS701-like DDE domain-containing protein n=1 Tax=Streptomyces javensis TaxID=114698 RepID=A0ABP4H4Z9_9ACTN